MDFIYGRVAQQGRDAHHRAAGHGVVKNECVSKIVATLKPGAGVVTTRNHVHYVVTEHGVADLYGKTLRQRARALIDIAAPEFRAELEQKAIEMKYL